MAVKRPSDIPEQWWRDACEVISHPLACVAPDHTYVWANSSYCRLIGYSVAELRELKWMDITVSDDVAGDLASVKEVVEGKIDSYSLSKRYRHRRGHEIACEITAWRFPRVAGNLVCFIVQAVPDMLTKDELRVCHQECMQVIDELKGRVSHIEKYREQQIMANRERDSQVVNVGNNSTDALKIAAGVIIALIAAVAYFAYIAGWPQHGGGAQPPHIHQQERSTQE